MNSKSKLTPISKDQNQVCDFRKKIEELVKDKTKAKKAALILSGWLNKK